MIEPIIDGVVKEAHRRPWCCHQARTLAEGFGAPCSTRADRAESVVGPTRCAVVGRRDIGGWEVFSGGLGFVRCFELRGVDRCWSSGGRVAGTHAFLSAGSSPILAISSIPTPWAVQLRTARHNAGSASENRCQLLNLAGVARSEIVIVNLIANLVKPVAYDLGVELTIEDALGQANKEA